VKLQDQPMISLFVSSTRHSGSYRDWQKALLGLESIRGGRVACQAYLWSESRAHFLAQEKN
jgi:hypothetical protein